MKRAFYTSTVDKEFEHTMLYKSEEDRERFMEYCQLYHSLGELGFGTLRLGESSGTKRMLYLFFLLLQPMNVPYAWSLFVAAVFSSVAQKTKSERNNRIVNFL